MPRRACGISEVANPSLAASFSRASVWLTGRTSPDRPISPNTTASFGTASPVKDESSAAAEVDIHPYDEDCTQLQIDRLEAVRRSRDNARVHRLLDELCGQAASDDVNLLPKTIELVKAKATLGEICGALRRVWGSYTEPMIV